MTPEFSKREIFESKKALEMMKDLIENNKFESSEFNLSLLDDIEVLDEEGEIN